MKRIIFFITIISGLSSCEYDNYDPPQSELSGRLLYEGDPVGVRQGINIFQLYEPGWENFEPIGLNVKQDGTFSARLFDGDYQLVLIDGNGPWVNQSDTIDIRVDGNREMDVAVEPFFMVRNENFEIEGSTLKISFDIEQVVESADLQFVSLYIGKTMLVDNQFNANEKRLPSGGIEDLDETISMEMDISGIDQEFLFARIGIKTKGSPELIFSEAEKITF
ncbi:DUF3823 domain-containing protein [Sinomicrobium pectinilyticum]|nr:DUF3823 domain-containing protein [Sinomicrobium pectinilyticum]